MSEATTITSSAAAATPSGDRIIIDGAALDLDEIVDQSFFAPKRVAALHETFVSAKPFPHIVF
jgi:hypothetical protein